MDCNRRAASFAARRFSSFSGYRRQCRQMVWPATHNDAGGGQ